MNAKYEVSISYSSKVITKVKVDRQTDKQTDRRKTICPRSFDPGAQKKQKNLLKCFTQEYATSGLDPTLKRHLDPTGKYVQISLQIQVSLH